MKKKSQNWSENELQLLILGIRNEKRDIDKVSGNLSFFAVNDINAFFKFLVHVQTNIANK